MSRSLVYVAGDEVRVTVEVFLEDLFLFHDLQPNAADYLGAATIQQGIELHREFVADRFVVQNVDGHRLQVGQPVDVSFDVPDGGVALAELMSHKLTFELRYPLEASPEFLTFSQRFSGDDGVLPAEMQLTVKQEGGDVLYNKALVTGVPVTLRLAWDRPALSETSSDQERAAWLADEQQKTLGLTSYSSVYSFLYVEDFEVRHEILIPLLTLQQLIRLPHDSDEFFSLAEQQAAIPLIADYFRTGNPIHINGRDSEAVVSRCDFYGLDFRDLARRAEPQQVSLSSARVGIILSYPLKEAAAHVRLHWDRFAKMLWSVNVVVFDGAAGFRKTLTRVGGNDTVEWASDVRRILPDVQLVPAKPARRPAVDISSISVGLLLLAIAVLGRRVAKAGMDRRSAVATVVLLGCSWAMRDTGVGKLTVPIGPRPSITDDAAAAVFATLHANIYTAFRFRTENDVYDALAFSADGDVLQDTYLSIVEGLKMEEQGGAVARVRQVDILDGHRRQLVGQPHSERQPAEFAYRCRWNVSGTVEHWGHIHERTNQFEADFRVASVGGNWKVTDIDIVDNRRLNFSTGVRELLKAVD
ncbi:MAG: hypothetical protein GY903_16210 [Fuerstiella sp.]|nr:hypothetical protein [Fuerstiella sp.]MCP4856028.1 hypothetical protein [Fuerstiella sp.]